MNVDQLFDTQEEILLELKPAQNDASNDCVMIGIVHLVTFVQSSLSINLFTIMTYLTCIFD